MPAGGRTRAGAIVVCTALLVAGCRSADDGTVEGEVPDVEPTTTSTTSTSTTTTTIPACGAVVELPGEPDEIADLDGDGEDDRVHLAPREDGREPDVHVLQVVLGAGGGASTDIPADPVALPGVIGAAALEREGRADVLWVRVGAGASATILGVYHLEGCALAAATFENGEPVELAIGGTVGTASGASCGSGADPEADLLVYEATLRDGDEYEVVTTEYRWEHGVLVRSASEPTVTRSADVTEASGFRCGDVSL